MFNLSQIPSTELYVNIVESNPMFHLQVSISNHQGIL